MQINIYVIYHFFFIEARLTFFLLRFFLLLEHYFSEILKCQNIIFVVSDNALYIDCFPSFLLKNDSKLWCCES